MASDHHAAHPSWSASKENNDGAQQPSKRVKQRASVPGRIWQVLVDRKSVV